MPAEAGSGAVTSRRWRFLSPERWEGFAVVPRAELRSGTETHIKGKIKGIKSVFRS